MRLLAFTDTHGGSLAGIRKAIATHRPDVLVCTGDFTTFGNSVGRILDEFDALGLPLVLIHGNHEDEDEIASLTAGKTNIVWAHGRIVTVRGLTFFGFGGGGFSQHEPELERLAEELGGRIDGQTILLSHAPPEGTLLDEIDEGWHVGNHSLRDLILRRRPMLVLCGHIHERFHARDTLAGTLLVNPGPEGELFEVDP